MKQTCLLATQVELENGRRRLATQFGDDSTIYALSTAPGRAAIAIVRCSGPRCLDIYKALCPGTLSPKPRHATLRKLYGPEGSNLAHQVLDSGAIVLYFPAPHTATGQDVLEYHIHGGPAVIKAVLTGISHSLASSPISLQTSIRYAEPGEFTRRAFYNGRLDLTQAEALGDTLAAETEQQRQLAILGASNTLSERYESWRGLLLQARGELEALIDFSEDQHFDESSMNLTTSVANQIIDLRQRIQASIENAAKGELLRGGISIALLGAPNAGKSSLLNQIVGREAAIVSKEAGTTRDVVEVNVDIAGFFCKFGDLAGLRASSGSDCTTAYSAIGEIESEGIRRAKTRALSADVVIVVLELEHDPQDQSGFTVRIDPEVEDTLSKCDLQRQRVVFAVNKMDQVSGNWNGSQSLHTAFSPNVPEPLTHAPIFHISCIDSSQDSVSILPPGLTTGIQPLLRGLSETFTSLTAASSLSGKSSPGSTWDESLGASERQRQLLASAAEHLDEFLHLVGHGRSSFTDEGQEIDVVLAAESLRAAAESLGLITGKGGAGDVEAVLGVVFEKFCVGK